ncbi:MAG: multicopper oxidase domain-containing protein, partial [Gemmatimonadota bacterium]
MHRINGLSFDMDRVDVQVPFGQVERWTFRNESVHPHPVHMHGTHFQVMTRLGGRGTVYPYERGWKDTVLVMPLETVEVLIQFNAYRGLFLLHCHNLEHEDLGMMLNVEVT